MNPYDIAELRRCLTLCYRMMVASTSLLEFAIPRSSGQLRSYYEKHLHEEAGHDEMLLEDLKQLGLPVIPRSHIAAKIAGSQYYLIAHEHPALLLGYMMALEKESMTLPQVAELSRFHGVPLTALRHHAEHDPQHFQDLMREFNTLDTELRNLVRWNHDCVTQDLEEAMQ